MNEKRRPEKRRLSCPQSSASDSLSVVLTDDDRLHPDDRDGASDTRPVFGYIRVSSNAQEVERQEQGIPKRHRSLPDNLGDNNLILFYEEHGTSAWSGKPRPTFADMYARLQKGEASALIVDTSSRLTRQGMRAALTIFFALQDVQTRLFTTQGREYPFDLGGLISLIVDSESDERYSSTLSHNISTGKAARFSAGRPYHGLLPPGLRQFDGEIHRTDDLPIMVEAFRRFAEKRETFAVICTWLNGALSDDAISRYKNRRITPDRLRAWLRHPIYTGLLRRKNDLYPWTDDPPVSLELYEAAQKRLDDNRDYSFRPPRDWPFTGVARCGACGHSLRQHPVTQRQGHVYVYLRCANPSCREKLPYASAFEANAVAGLASIGFALLEALYGSDDFGNPDSDAPTVEEARESLALAQTHFEELGGAVADGALSREDPRYIDAKQARDDARSAVELASRDAKSHRDELFSLAQRILSLSSLAPVDVELEDDGPGVYFDGQELPYPERTIPRVLLGWEEADFDTKKAIIHESLTRLTTTLDELEFHFRVPLPLTITLHPTIESIRSEDVRAIEHEGWGQAVGHSAPQL